MGGNWRWVEFVFGFDALFGSSEHCDKFPVDLSSCGMNLFIENGTGLFKSGLTAGVEAVVTVKLIEWEGIPSLIKSLCWRNSTELRDCGSEQISLFAFKLQLLLMLSDLCICACSWSTRSSAQKNGETVPGTSSLIENCTLTEHDRGFTSSDFASASNFICRKKGRDRKSVV